MYSNGKSILEKAPPVGHINKYGKQKQPNGSWKYVGKERSVNLPKKKEGGVSFSSSISEVSFSDIRNQMEGIVSHSEQSEERKYANQYNGMIDRLEHFGKKTEEDKKHEFETAFKTLNVDSLQELVDFFGGSPIIALETDELSNSVTALTETGFFERVVKEKKVYNNIFYLSPLLKKGQKIGTRTFTNQINQYKKQGFQEIETEAYKGPGSNGYYTWARLGYSIANEQGKKKMASLVKRGDDSRIKNCKTLPELMSFKEGREFWKKNGFTFTGVFDLSDSSESTLIFNKYINGI